MITQLKSRGSQVRRSINCGLINTLLTPRVYVGHFEHGITGILHDDFKRVLTSDNEDGGTCYYIIPILKQYNAHIQ